MDKIRLILVLFSIALLALLIVYAEPGKLVSTLASANLTYVLLGILCILLAIILRIWRWKMLVGELSFSEIAPIQLFGTAISNIAPAKASEPLKAVLLKTNYGISLAKGFSSTVVERISDLIAVVLISAFALLYIPLQIVIVPILIFGGLVAGIIVSAQSKPLQSFGLRLVARFSKRLAESGKRFIEGLKLDKKFLFAVSLALPIWALDSATAIFALMSLGAMPNVPNPYLAVAGLMCFATLVGLLSLLPGGLGSTDISFAIMLQWLGVGSALSISAVLLFRLLTFWSGLAIGLSASAFIKKKQGVG
jgi:uncharacterized protein (TIRG00374 family)